MEDHSSSTEDLARYKQHGRYLAGDPVEDSEDPSAGDQYLDGPPQKRSRISSSALQHESFVHSFQHMDSRSNLGSEKYDNDDFGLMDVSEIEDLLEGKERNDLESSDVFMSNSEGCDTCFGMLQVDAINLATLSSSDHNPTEVSLRIQPNLITVHHLGSNEYAGLLNPRSACAVQQLYQKFIVEFSAFVRPANSTEEVRTASRGSQKQLWIILYGFQKDIKEVGSLLAANELYLQHPYQFDQSKTYANPHYLARPGQKFHLPSSVAGSEPKDEDSALHEIEKELILRIFDCAQGPDTVSLVQTTSKLRIELKPHQKTALAMMMEKEAGKLEESQFPSLWEAKTVGNKEKRYYNVVTGGPERDIGKRYRGGLLADDMGLGKTLTTLALIATSSFATFDQTDSSDRQSRSQSMTLVITPKSTIPVWEEQINKHFEPESLRLFVYHGSNRAFDGSIPPGYHVIISTYETLTNELRSKPLHSHDWLRVVLDEAHVIRDRNSLRHRAVCNLTARYRWCLTGTPIHNKVDDYGALISFLRVVPFNEKQYFNQHITYPIKSKDKIGFERLKKLVQSTSLRRTKTTEQIGIHLPARENIVEFVELNEEERHLHNIIKKSAAVLSDLCDANNNGRMGNVLSTITKLRQVCNHGRWLLSTATLAALKSYDLPEFSFDISHGLEVCVRCARIPNASKMDELINSHVSYHQSMAENCLFTAKNAENMFSSSICDACSKFDSQRTIDNLESNNPTTIQYEAYDPSSKVLALMKNLQNDCLSICSPPIKSVVFTCWEKMLDLIEKAVTLMGLGFQRIDGSKSIKQRRDAMRLFSGNDKYTIMLASIECAALGLDLTAASRVHLVEPHWNPMVEKQALDRVYRIGQKRKVISYRYIVKDSIEEYVQKIQKNKLDLSKRVIDGEIISQKEIDKERSDMLRAALS